MDNQGWIKLHRKILDNQDLFGKNYDFALFTYFILKADRNTGIARVGRKDLAKRFRAGESAIYKAMKRIERGGLCNIKSNNQFSDVYICKYQEYQSQSNNESNSKVTTKEQQSNTIQEVRSKNKENIYRYIDSLNEELSVEVAKQYSVSLVAVRKLSEDLKLYCQSKGKKYANYKAALQNWVRRAIDEKKITKVVNTTVEDDPDYDPEVARQNIEKLREMRNGIIKSI